MKNINTMCIFVGIFALISIIHISAIFFGKRKLRRISKVFIIPPLLAAYIAGTGNLLLFPVPALILGWIGDVLLITKEKKNHFKLGLVSFLLGHICYIITFIDLLGILKFDGAAGKINITAFAVSVPLAIFLGIAAFRFIKPSEEMLFPGIIYMIALETMAIWAMQVFIFNPGFAGAMIFSGALSFIISDIILAYYTFRKLNRRGAVSIMLLYILAQAGIILGLLSLLAA